MIYYKIYKDLQFIWIKVHKADSEEIMKFYENILGHEDYSKSFSGIIDFRGAEMNLTYKEAREIGKYSAKKRISKGKWAMLVDKPMETALVTFYQNEVSVNHPISIFSTIDGAMNYIGVKMSQIDMHVTDEKFQPFQ